MMENDGDLTLEEATAAVKAEDAAPPADARKENLDPLGTETDTPLPPTLKAVDANGNGTEQIANESVAR